MIFTILAVGLGLLLLNAALVYFIRNSRTFAIYPGIIFLILFISFAVYLFYSLTAYSPEVGLAKQPAGKGKLTAMPSAGKIITADEEKVKKKEEMKEDICNFLTVMIIQSLLAAIAAFIGSKIVPGKKNYYFGFLFLYVFLFVVMSSLEYLIKYRLD